VRVCRAGERRDETTSICPSCQCAAVGIVDLAPKSKLYPSTSHPTEGRIMIVTNAGRAAMDATASGAQWDRRAGCCRERSAGARTNDAANRLRRNSPGGTRPGKTFGGDGRGRRSRVVLAPRCWRQVLRRCIRPNRAWDASSIRRATVARKPGHRGEYEVSRNTIAQGKPE
jgi:hypothetical protein